MDNFTVLEGFKEKKKQDERIGLVDALKELLELRKACMDEGMTAREADMMLSMLMDSAMRSAMESNK